MSNQYTPSTPHVQGIPAASPQIDSLCEAVSKIRKDQKEMKELLGNIEGYLAKICELMSVEQRMEYLKNNYATLFDMDDFVRKNNRRRGKK